LPVWIASLRDLATGSVDGSVLAKVMDLDCTRLKQRPGSLLGALRWTVPYRVDLRNAGDDALDRLVELGAIDAEVSHDDGIAALMPDSVSPEQVASALGVDDLSVSPAVGRDAGSVWILSPRETRIGQLRIVPADTETEAAALRLIDAGAFGTGLHPTTALCLEALQDAVQTDCPHALLDVGTGSGVLALAALMMGVPRAMGIDIDDEALRVAAENARINALDDRLQLVTGGPNAVTGTWPLVLANVLASPLIEMAPALVRRVGHEGTLVLSGIPDSVEEDVDHAYRRLGMQRVGKTSRSGWVALVMQASW
jgi:ribosomal protein L11 methyltransferase